jgi:hypothetical protein
MVNLTFTDVNQKKNRLSGALELNYYYNLDYRMMAKCGMVVEERLAENFSLKVNVVQTKPNLHVLPVVEAG